MQQKNGVIDSETTGAYSENEQIKFLTNSIESSLCDYSDAYILVMGNINSWGNDTKAAFKNCAPFRTCITQINETFVNEAKHINITIPMYNLIEYSDNYSDNSVSLWKFKADNSSSFKHKSNFIGTLPNGGRKNGVKIAVSLKYLSNF